MIFKKIKIFKKFKPKIANNPFYKRNCINLINKILNKKLNQKQLNIKNFMIYKKIITVSKDLNKFLIKDQKRIKDAIIQLNKYGKRILFVVDKDNSAMGSLSDGDIRKGLLKGLQLGDKLNLVVNKKFIFIKIKIL